MIRRACRAAYQALDWFPLGLEVQSLIRLLDKRFRGDVARAVSVELRYMRIRAEREMQLFGNGGFPPGSEAARAFRAGVRMAVEARRRREEDASR